MRAIVVGLGIQGKKRLKVAGNDVTGIVDPVHADAKFKSVIDVPLNSYDIALVCTPDQAKIEILNYLLENKKHVLVEKPLVAKEPKDLEKLKELSKKNNVTVYTAYNHRFEPHIAKLQKNLGDLGKVYMARFFYGNGTARDVRNSLWRDQGSGVLKDLGSHLLDLSLFLFGGVEKHSAMTFSPWSFDCFENKAFDHIVFGNNRVSAADPLLNFEASLLSFKNCFTVDVFGENGSAHINGLCKWGPSTITFRKRVLPSGKPDQEESMLECADPTWGKEHEYFKSLCETGTSNIQNDIWINSTLTGLVGASL